MCFFHFENKDQLFPNWKVQDDSNRLLCLFRTICVWPWSTLRFPHDRALLYECGFPLNSKCYKIGI